MATDNIQVAVRCRPLNKREKSLKCENIVLINKAEKQIVLKNDKSGKVKSFSFDHVYDDDAQQEQVYNQIAFPLIESVFAGYNATIFAYGQTGCGKTWTMEGPRKTPDASLRGIIPNSFIQIFDTINVNKVATTKYLVSVAYIEIYNEEIRDLLGSNPEKRLALRQSPDKGVYVADLSRNIVTNVDQTQSLMDRGNGNRVVGATEMNALSSRSHSIFVINVETAEMDEETKEERIRVGKLNLVDLAGSERQSKTKAAGQRLKEATKINLSLSALGNVISALVEGKGKHIPYRDSKLTRLLQDSLGGNTKTAMVACISPASDNYDETLSTLRYANRAKNIKNKPKINEDPKDAMIRKYQEEISKLKVMLQKTTNGTGSGVASVQVVKEADPEQVRILQDQLSEMKTAIEERDGYMKELLKAKQDLEHEKKALKQRLASGEGTEEEFTELERQSSLLQTQVNEVQEEKHKAEEYVEQLKLAEEKIAGGETIDVAEQLKMMESQVISGAEEMKELQESKLRLLRHKEAYKQKYKSTKKLMKTRKNQEVQRLKQELSEAQDEIYDLHTEFQHERETMLDDIRALSKDLGLYKKIVERLIPLDILEPLLEDAKWNPETKNWELPLKLDNIKPSIKSPNRMKNPFHRIKNVFKQEELLKKKRPKKLHFGQRLRTLRELTKGSTIKQILHSSVSTVKPSKQAISIDDLPDLGVWKFSPGEVSAQQLSDEEPDVYIENKAFYPSSGDSHNLAEDSDMIADILDHELEQSIFSPGPKPPDPTIPTGLSIPEPKMENKNFSELKSLLKDADSPRELGGIEQILLKSPMKNRAFSPTFISPQVPPMPSNDVDYLLSLPKSRNREFGRSPTGEFSNEEDPFLKINKPAFRPAATEF